MKRSTYRAGFFLMLCLAMALSTGCSEDVTAIIGGEGAYAFYGVISPDLEFQSIRVYPFEGVLAPLPNAPLDAVVTSTDLHSGEINVWQDSITVDENDQYGHVFWSPFRAQHGHTYRIEVERSDGARSHVEVAVPLPIRVDEEEANGTALLPIRISGAAPRLLHTHAEYRVQGYVKTSDGNVGPIGQPLAVRVPQAGREIRTGDDWLVRVNLTYDYEAVRREVGASLGDTGVYSGTLYVLLVSMDFTATVASEDWYPPGGVFDPDVVGNLGTLSNVENGAGFVGAGYRVDVDVFPSREAYLRAGFIGWEEVQELEN